MATCEETFGGWGQGWVLGVGATRTGETGGQSMMSDLSDSVQIALQPSREQCSLRPAELGRRVMLWVHGRVPDM